MLRFNVGTLLIVTTLVAGLVAVSKYGAAAVIVYGVFGCAGLFFATAAIEGARIEKAITEREKGDRQAD